MSLNFPHDVHIASTTFGQSGVLADGCFACHDFEQPRDGTAFQAVPRIKPEAANCAACHTGHDHIGGGACQQCHPAERNGANSFTVSAKVPDRGLPTRPWPAPNGFSHLSRGHSTPDLTCASCHGDSGLERAEVAGGCSRAGRVS